MKGALTRYRVMAYVVGTGLLLLVFVAMPLKHFFDRPLMVQIVAPAHGYLYIVYLVCAMEVAVRSRWPLMRTVGVLLAGTIPFMSFVAERRTVALVRAAGAPPRREVVPAATQEAPAPEPDRAGP